jgi:biotin carboxyl carrier protein
MSTQSPSRAQQRQAANAARNQRADRSELAVSTTSPEWDGRPHHRRLPRLTSLLLVLGILAVCVLIAVTQIARRLADRDVLQVQQAVLTSDPVSFEASSVGQVVSVAVEEGTSVNKGAEIAVIRYASPVSDAAALEEKLFAPADGIISHVSVAAGENVIGGKELITMYQPGQMYFEVPMTYDDASELKVGDRATFDVPGIGDVKGTVAGIQSDFGEAGEEEVERLAHVVVRPNNPEDINDAAPGVVTDGEIDKGSAPAGAPRAIFAER